MVKNSQKPLRVAELFAGVGGFRIGLESCKGRYNVVWSNQWEPATKKQHASDIYIARFGEDGHSNVDISKVPVEDIPAHDVLVGGFPCQDYSVARTLSQAEGLVGKKGVLWWEIYRILKEKGNKRPDYLILENVDRLLKSPAKQRGRDFGIMLASLSDLGYIVEWRVINAADYGMPQRRRRVFIVGYKKGTATYKKISSLKNPADWILSDGTIARAFPVVQDKKDAPVFVEDLTLEGDIVSISNNFKGHGNRTPFAVTGMIIDRKVITAKTVPNYKGERIVLGDVLLDETEVPPEYYISEKDLERWRYLKGSKKETRRTKAGFEYQYSEGPMAFPDPLDKPSRTIVTGEGGATPSRFKHVIFKNGKYRRLTPVELEQLNMFPKGHTKGVPDVRRAFFMGNALVVGIVERLGRELLKQVQ